MWKQNLASYRCSCNSRFYKLLSATTNTAQMPEYQLSSTIRITRLSRLYKTGFWHVLHRRYFSATNMWYFTLWSPLPGRCVEFGGYRFTSSGQLGKSGSGGWFNIKMSSYQYRKSHSGVRTILRPSYLQNGISYTGKMRSLYWIWAWLWWMPAVCVLVSSFLLVKSRLINIQLKI